MQKGLKVYSTQGSPFAGFFYKENGTFVETKAPPNFGTPDVPYSKLLYSLGLLPSKPN